jgi:short-subunit dehydrogenase
MPETARSYPFDFKNRYGAWVVVAGASQGLGAAFARQLAARGLNLVLVARRTGLLEKLAADLSRQFSVQVRPLTLDLSAPQAAEQIDTLTAGLDLGLLVYNAAYSAVGPLYDHLLADRLREIDTNVRTPLDLTYRLGQRMLANGHGGVILMSSLSAFQGSAYISNYSATKAYSLVLAEGLWEEWRPRGVDVLVCVAGAIKTPNFEASAPRHTGRFSDATMEPEAVAGAALAALGRQPYVIPGRSNRLSSFVMRHLLPRRVSIRLMGRILHDMYVR